MKFKAWLKIFLESTFAEYFARAYCRKDGKGYQKYDWEI